jgi:dCTP deaminase
MILNDIALETHRLAGTLVWPVEPWQVQPASIDVRLSSRLLLPRAPQTSHVIDPYGPEPSFTALDAHVIGDAGFAMYPGELVLGATYERVAIPPDLLGRIEGKSSLGRLGLFVHITAGFLDPGFTGTVTLELYNAASRPIILRSMQPIAQIAFERLTGTVARAYGDPGLRSHYQNQDAPTAARFEVTR